MSHKILQTDGNFRDNIAETLKKEPTSKVEERSQHNYIKIIT